MDAHVIDCCRSMTKPGLELCQPGALIQAPFGVKMPVKSFVTELNSVLSTIHNIKPSFLCGFAKCFVCRE